MAIYTNSEVVLEIFLYSLCWDCIYCKIGNTLYHHFIIAEFSEIYLEKIQSVCSSRWILNCDLNISIQCEPLGRTCSIVSHLPPYLLKTEGFRFLYLCLIAYFLSVKEKPDSIRLTLLQN